MCTPTTPPETTSSMPEWYDPFFEPQTYPAGWDVSGLCSEPVVNAPEPKTLA